MRQLSLLLAALILSLTAVNYAQTNAGTFADATNPAGPPSPQHKSEIWRLDPITGAVSLKITVFNMPHPGLGPNIPYVLEYNSASSLILSALGPPQLLENDADVLGANAQQSQLYTWTTPIGSAGGLVPNAPPPGPWTANGPMQYETLTKIAPPTTGSNQGPPNSNSISEGCAVYGPYIYIDENGKGHDLNSVTTVYTSAQSSTVFPCSNWPIAAAVSPSTTDDGSFLLVTNNSGLNGFANLGITYPNGTIRNSNGGLTDANGNASVQMFSSTYNPSSLTPSTSTVTTHTAAGAPATWTIQTQSYPVSLGSLPEPNSADMLPNSTNGTQSVVIANPTPGSILGISSIQLPDTTSYQFDYDPTYGTISKVTFPTGGYVRFVWGIRTNGTYTRLSMANGMSTVVATDVYESDGVDPEYHWHYSYANLAVPGSIVSLPLVSTETDPEGTVTTYTGVPFQFSTIFTDGQPTYLETNRTISSNTGAMLRTIATARNSYGLPYRVTTTFYPSSLNQTVNYNYDQYGNVIEKDESGLYTGSTPTWVRKTLTTYYWAQYPAYLSAYIVDKPYTVTVENGSGTPMSETMYNYDQSTPIPHGNLTSFQKCLTLSSSGCSVWLPVTSYQYDSLGERTYATDPNGNTTHYIYQGGYVTNIVRPNVNGVSHTSSYTYSSYTGQMLSLTDENKQTTTYSYNDPLFRMTSITLPVTVDGTNGSSGAGATTYTYTDSPGNWSVQKRITQNLSGGNITSIKTYDGLGRLKTTAITTGVDGPITISRTYDALGRLSSISNPFQTTSASSDGTTRYSYDGLNRKTQQIHPDNSMLQWCYDGVATNGQTNCIANASSQGNVEWQDFSDENGNHWQHIYDGLGRLVAVMEPNASDLPSTETDYIYDALDNLTGVAQGGQSRSFAYDGLSRLMTATNPESGTTGYTYDFDSNLHTKTDARGITTTYGYDALNRVTGKTYSDTTYPVSYSYDTSSAPNATNIIGRLTDEKTTVQTVTMTERAIDQYDAVGRTLSERQCFVGGCNGTPYTLTHSYDLAGEMTGSSNGIAGANAASFRYGFDGAERLQSVTSTLNDALHPATLFQATQFSAIGLTQANFAAPAGSGAGAYSQTLSYDNRMRLAGETDSVAAPSPAMLYSYGLGYYANNNVHTLTDSQMGTWGYIYDPLNRLSTATATAGVYAGLTLTEAYDSFGNRGSQTVSGSSSAGVPQPAPVTFKGTNNRVDQWVYDAAGDVLNDTNSAYEYDAEGKQTGTYNQLNGLTGYVYDAEGRRVEKVLVNGFGTPTPSTTVQQAYLLGLSGEQVSVLDGSGNWKWSNVYAGGKALATYDSTGTHFTLTDWLGSKRELVNITGASTVAVGEQCQNLPFGDGQNCTGTDVNQLHFTGKQRDIESTNDYFGARFYASNIAGRFLTPDWSKNPQGVPYATFTNPQSLNLYSYVKNNPLTNTDSDGHACVFGITLFGSHFGGSCPGDTPPAPPLAPSIPQGAPGSQTGPLVNAQDNARNNPAFQPSTNGTTHCNQATCAIATETGAPTGPLTNGQDTPALANQQAANLGEPNSGYHQVSPSEAQSLANQGETVLAVQPHSGHGHIATVRPNNTYSAPYENSDSRGTGPMINNIGAHVDVVPQSGAFYTNPSVRYYAPNR